MPTFTPPFGPEVGATYQTQPRILMATFGDGYEQRAGDGLNTMLRTVQLRFNGLTETEADDIITFLTARGGHESFTYALPRESESKWRCPSWNRVPLDGNLDAIEVEFKEVADL